MAAIRKSNFRSEKFAANASENRASFLSNRAAAFQLETNGALRRSPSRWPGGLGIACTKVMTNVAINGLGRIGRATLKIAMDRPGLNLVAANDIGTSESIEYLLRFDTVYGRYEKPVQATSDGHLKIGERRLRLLHERDPGRLPWKAMSVDIVFECTGAFTTREDLAAHVHAGARYVILSAPSKGDGNRTTTIDEVNHVFTEEANSQRYRGILGVTSDPIVSSDIIKDPRASIVDLGMTLVVDGDLVKMMSWYDNERGYSNQLVREAVRVAAEIDQQHVGRPA